MTEPAKKAPRKLCANELDALWDEVIAKRAITFRWVPPRDTIEKIAISEESGARSDENGSKRYV